MFYLLNVYFIPNDTYYIRNVIFNVLINLVNKFALDNVFIKSMFFFYFCLNAELYFTLI